MEEGSSSSQESDSVFQFDDFELNTRTCTLRKAGAPVKLQRRPLQILEALLKRPGELVTRQELASRLWPNGTFVEFEAGLNTATNRLRKALGDSVERPRFVETLPRLGYRFICPITTSPGQSVATTLKKTAGDREGGRMGRAPGRRSLRLAAMIAAAVAASAILISNFKSSVPKPRSTPTFQRINMRAGRVKSAQFIPSSDDVSYTIRLPNGGNETYLYHTKDVTAQELDSRLAPKSHSAQAAASVHPIGGESAVEYPAGHVIYRTTGWIDGLRVSPNGEAVAFLEHPMRDDDAGGVRVVRRNGANRLITACWSTIKGLAWSPSGKEIWFTASRNGSRRALYAVSDTGRLRQISDVPSTSILLLDISASGSVLVELEDDRESLMAELAGDQTPRDLSKLDFSHVEDISRDGNLLLFTEGGDGGGSHYTSYLYDKTSHQTACVSAGRGLALSPDGRSVLTVDPRDRTSLRLTSRNGGEVQNIFGRGFLYQWARFLGNSHTLLVGGSYPGEALGIFKQEIGRNSLSRVNGAPYLDYVRVSQDGTKMAGATDDFQCLIFDFGTGKAQLLMLPKPAMPVTWSADGNEVYLALVGGSEQKIVRASIVDPAFEEWKSLGSRDPSDYAGLASVAAAPESGAFAYSVRTTFSNLYVVNGWL